MKLGPEHRLILQNQLAIMRHLTSGPTDALHRHITRTRDVLRDDEDERRESARVHGIAAAAAFDGAH